MTKLNTRTRTPYKKNSDFQTNYLNPNWLPRSSLTPAIRYSFCLCHSIFKALEARPLGYTCPDDQHWRWRRCFQSDWGWRRRCRNQIEDAAVRRRRWRNQVVRLLGVRMNGRAACQSQTDEAAACPAALGVLEEKAEREWKAMEKNGEGKNNFWADGVDAWTGLGHG